MRPASIVINLSNGKLYISGASGGNGLDLPDNYYGTFRIGELGGTGGNVTAGWATNGNTIFVIGALNTTNTYSGVLVDNIRTTGSLTGGELA